jgi:branched-chain amino acid transport system substrate-binding protein
MNGVIPDLQRGDCLCHTYGRPPQRAILDAAPPRLPLELLAIGALLVAVLLLAACGQAAPLAPDAASAATAGARNVAVVAPLSGGAAAAGQQQLNFARLAVEDFNRERGSDYGLVEADTGLDPNRAQVVARRLVSDPSVYAIVGPSVSQEVSAVAPVTAPEHLAMVSPSATHPSLTDRGPRNFFRVVPRDDEQGATDARFIADALRARRVWIVDDGSGYSKGLADEIHQALRTLGIAVNRESISQRDADFSALVTRLQADAPDVVFIPWQLPAQGALLARQMADQGISTRVMGGDGLFGADEFIQAAAGATEGAYASFFAPDVTAVPSARPVVEAYRARYGEVHPFGAPAYAATMVALEAIERASARGPLSRNAVRLEIARTNQPTSVLGTPIAFDAKGDVLQATFHLYQVRDGRFVPLAKGTPPRPANAGGS